MIFSYIRFQQFIVFGKNTRKKNTLVTPREVDKYLIKRRLGTSISEEL